MVRDIPTLNNDELKNIQIIYEMRADCLSYHLFAKNCSHA